MDTQLTVEQQETLEKEIAPVVKTAADLVIKTPEQSMVAQEILRDIKRRQKKIQEFFAGMKTAAHAAWKKICDTEGGYLAPLAEAEMTIKRKVITYTNEEERKRQEEVRAAEAKRQEEERKRKEEIERQAKKAEENGKTEKAQALREKAEETMIPPVFVPPPPPRAEGMALRKVWVADCVDLKALCGAIAEGKASVGLVTPNQPGINAFAKAVKDTMPIAGLKFYERTDMAVRS